jgi:NusA-like KH domain protein
MAQVIDMQTMRHLNLFGKITRISTRFCFTHNNTIFFCVPRQLVSRAIGREGANIKQIHNILRKRVKIIPQPRGPQDMKSFIEAIVAPIKVNELEIQNGVAIASGSRQSKAALIGRNKRRLIEMQKIISDFFRLDFRVG